MANATLEIGAANGSRVLKTGALAVSGTGKINLQDNKTITTSAVGSAAEGVYNGVTGLIQSGRGNGTWNGSIGIVTGQTQATTSNFTNIGIATASEAKGIAATATALWAGQTVTGSNTLVMYTYGGDANLDGKINVDDYGKIDFAVPLGIAGWANGDFNYDGKINVDDYGIIDFNVGTQGAPFSTADSLPLVGFAAAATPTAVPEPAVATLLLCALSSALLHRRRRH